MSEPQKTFSDVGKLKQTLVAFLSSGRSDWRTLSRELEQLAGEADQQQDDREAWLLLADYLAHSDRASGVPPEVRRLLESDDIARATEAAFNESMALRDSWANFAQQIDRPRNER